MKMSSKGKSGGKATAAPSGALSNAAMSQTNGTPAVVAVVSQPENSADPGKQEVGESRTTRMGKETPKTKEAANTRSASKKKSNEDGNPVKTSAR